MDIDKPINIIEPTKVDVGQVYHVKGTVDLITILSTTVKDKMYPNKNILVSCSNGFNYFYNEQALKERC